MAQRGDATRASMLEQVEASRASRVVIGTNRDDTTVLATPTVRQLNATATIVAVRNIGTAQSGT